jgi:NAD(P)-dependent dehydrogenase (short-subunit alcohol dehydrogenase family)/cytochrome b561
VADTQNAPFSNQAQVSRYHPLLVTLHWLLAALLVAALAAGSQVLIKIPNTDPTKIEGLRQHIAGGILLLGLMLVRLIVRSRIPHPVQASTGSSALDRAVSLSHRLLYVLVLAQAVSGLALALQTRLWDVVVSGQGALPVDFWVFPVRSVHYAISRALMALITLHVVAALYHTFILRDGLLTRIWFGRRILPPGAVAPTHVKAQGKVIVITGANAGIGFTTALSLAKEGAQIVMVCRNTDRGNAARQAIAQVASRPPLLFIADLSSRDSVYELSATLHKQLSRIDVLINNAGAAFAKRELTVDGIERTFATNHLAPFLLTNLVLDLVRKSSAGRIVNLTAGIPVARSSFLENLQGEKHYGQFSAYSSSKMGNILFTRELARRLEYTGITVNCVHPGPVRTNFTLKAGGHLLFVSRILRPIMRSPEAGARGPIYLATDPEVASVTGAYFVNCKQRKGPAMTYDHLLAERHWRISEELTLLNAGAKGVRGASSSRGESVATGSIPVPPTIPD